MINKALDWLLDPDTYGPIPFIMKAFMALSILVVIFVEGMVSVAVALVTGRGVEWYLLLVTWTLVYCSLLFISRPVIRSLLRMSECTQIILDSTWGTQRLRSHADLKRVLDRRIRSAILLIAFLWICVAVLLIAVTLPSDQVFDQFRVIRNP